jgi:glutaminase
MLMLLNTFKMIKMLNGTTKYKLKVKWVILRLKTTGQNENKRLASSEYKELIFNVRVKKNIEQYERQCAIIIPIQQIN